jgi:hypothetical protein
MFLFSIWNLPDDHVLIYLMKDGDIPDSESGHNQEPEKGIWWVEPHMCRIFFYDFLRT